MTGKPSANDSLSCPRFAEIAKAKVDLDHADFLMEAPPPKRSKAWLSVELYFPIRKGKNPYSRAIIWTSGRAEYPTVPPLVKGAALVDTTSLGRLAPVTQAVGGRHIDLHWDPKFTNHERAALAVVRYVPADIPMDRVDVNECMTSEVILSKALQHVSFMRPSFPQK